LNDADGDLARWIGSASGCEFLANGRNKELVGDIRLFWDGYRTEFGPGTAVVHGALDPRSPDRRVLAGGLDGGTADNDAVLEDEGFVFDGAEDAFGQVFFCTPCAAVVVAPLASASPDVGLFAVFVVEPEPAVLRMKKNGIPVGNAVGAGEFKGSGSGSIVEAGTVDCDIGCSFVSSSKPGSHDVAVFQLNQG
jgi:hypothetical protein